MIRTPSGGVRPTFRIGLALIALAAASIAPADAGSISGMIRGPVGEGLPGAVVTVALPSGDEVAYGVTGTGGIFRIDGLAPGDYVIRADLPAFHFTSASDVAVSEDEVTRIVLTLASRTFRDTVGVGASAPEGTIESMELREAAARDLGEALADRPGIWKVRKGGIANDIVVRGLREDDVTLLIDGARVAGACPNRMDPPAFHLDSAEIERVDVADGAGVMTAAGGLGAVVNVTTRRPSPGFAAQASLAAGSWDMRNPSAVVSLGSDRAAVLAGGSWRSGAPYEDGAGRRFTELANYVQEAGDADAYEVATGWIRAYFAPSDGHEVSLSVAHQEAEDLLYPALLMDAAYDDTDRLVLGYSWEAPGDTIVTGLRTTVYATRVDHWMTDRLRASSSGASHGWSMGTMAETEVGGVTGEVEIGSFVVGVDAYRRSWNVWTAMAGMGYARQASLPDVDSEVLGVSARWSGEIGDATALDLGIRHDWMDAAADPAIANTDLYAAYHLTRRTERDDAVPSATARLRRSLGAGTTLTVGLSRTARPPDPRELFFALKRGAADWVGNPRLETPRATRAEVALDLQGIAGFIRASAWIDRVDDFITVYGQDRRTEVPGVPNLRARSWANVDARLWGISLHGSRAVSNRLVVRASADLVRGSHDPRAELGIRDGNLAEIPPLTGRLAVRWHRPGLFAELEGVAADRQDRIDHDLGETPTPGWTVVNAVAGWERGPWRLQLNLDNLLDRDYAEHFSFQRDPFRSGVILHEPGRSFTVTAGFRNSH